MSEMSEESCLSPKCQFVEETKPTLLNRNKGSEESCIIVENQLVEQINSISSEINQETPEKCVWVEEIGPLSVDKNLDMSQESCVSNDNQFAGKTSTQTLETIKEICGESSSTIGSELILETIPQLIENKQETCEGPRLGKQNQLTGEKSSQSLEIIKDICGESYLTLEIELILDEIPTLAGIKQDMTPKIQLSPALIGSILEVSSVHQTFLLKVKTRSKTLESNQGTPEKSFMRLELNEESTPSKVETNQEAHDKFLMPHKLIEESTPTTLQTNQGAEKKSCVPLELNEEYTPAKSETNREAPDNSFIPLEQNEESTLASLDTNQGTHETLFLPLELNEDSTSAKPETNREAPDNSFNPHEQNVESTLASLDTNQGTHEKLFLPLELNEESTQAKSKTNQEAPDKTYMPFELNEESTPAKPETNQEAFDRPFIPLGKNEESTLASLDTNQGTHDKLFIPLELNEESTPAKPETPANQEALEKSLKPQKESTNPEKIVCNQSISENVSVISKSQLVKEQILESIDNIEVTSREPSMIKMQLLEEPSEKLLKSNEEISEELSTTPHSQSKIQPELKGYQMVGDSQFCRFGEQLLGLKRVPIANSPGRIGICVSGQTISELHKRVKDKFYPISDKIILMIGTNDFLRNNEVTVMCQELSELVRTLQETVSNIIILTLPPIPRLGKRNITEHSIMIEKYNQYIRSLRDGDKIKVADISPMYVKPEPFQWRMNLFEKYFHGGPRRYDLTHLNQKGLEVIRNYILENL